MRRLYHFPTSPFSRRVRLALAHKGLEATLCDARANPAFRDESQKAFAVKTVPVLVEDDGFALGDSAAITHYLDRAYPSTPPIWTGDPKRTLPLTVYVDTALHAIVDLGARYFPLHTSPAWDKTRGEIVSRIQLALDAIPGALEEIAHEPWGAPHIWAFTMERWLHGLPARIGQMPTIEHLLSLGWKVPPALTEWSQRQLERADVRSLDA